MSLSVSSQSGDTKMQSDNVKEKSEMVTSTIPSGGPSPEVDDIPDSSGKVTSPTTTVGQASEIDPKLR